MVGPPPTLHSDNHKNFNDGLFKQLLQLFGIIPTYMEPHSPWQNRAEPTIVEVKQHASNLMLESNNPIRLWCFYYKYTADILSLCAIGHFEFQGWTSYETVMNYTPDISEYTSFSWFQCSWLYDETLKSYQLCRWLGPVYRFGQAFFSYILEHLSLNRQ